MKMENLKFQIVGPNEKESEQVYPNKKGSYVQKLPIVSIVVLAFIVVGCLGASFLTQHNPAHMYLQHTSNAPNRKFWFGTDTLGRDVFSMIWYGGRVSLYIGVLATIVSTGIAIFYGTISGVAKSWMDDLMMRLADLLLSIPSILLIIFVQAVAGKQTPTAIAIVIGITSWMGVSKIVRTEVRQLRNVEFVLVSRTLGGRFLHILRKHLLPHFFSTILFMIVMNVSNAIMVESTLSFLGLGLPIESVSWGSMLSLSQKSLLTGDWWMIVFPGVFLITTILCITNIGNYIREQIESKQRYL